VLTLDEKRRRSNRLDIFCIKLRGAADPEPEDGMLYYITKRYFTRLLLNSIARPLIIILFAGGTAYSLGSLHNLDIGLDQKLSMPEDSYLIDYFETMSESLEVGAPVYFVVKVSLIFRNKWKTTILFLPETP
jgi:Niemann-Pick C1 protein